MNEFNERSSVLRCNNNCCVDDHQKCSVARENCEIVHQKGSKFTVMFEKWLHNVKIDKYSATKPAAAASSSSPGQSDDEEAEENIDLNKSSPQMIHQSPNITDNFPMACVTNESFEQFGMGAFCIPAMNSIRFSIQLIDRCQRYAAEWSKIVDSQNQCNHPDKLKMNRNECCLRSRSAQQSYNISSKQLMNDNHNLGDDRDKGIDISKWFHTAAASKKAQTNAMNGKFVTSTSLSASPLPPPPLAAAATPPRPQMPRSPAVSAKLSLKFVHRSPLSIIHRANLLPIFIKYLLILNCFMCFVSGNLMARNIGNNDLSSKLNHSSNPIDMHAAVGTTPPPSSPLHNGNGSQRGGGGGMPTTISPSILHSLISNNRSQLFQNASQALPSAGTTASVNAERSAKEARQILQQHTQDLLASGYVSDEPVSSFKVPNAEDSGSEEFSRCASCQFREQLKAQNLASIKMHILARLSMTHPPNITGRPHISEQILQTFYQNNDFRYIRIQNGSNGSGISNSFITDDRMQGDDPNASAGNQKHQHHHHQTSSSSYHHHRNTRIDNEYNEEYDYGDRGGGIVYNMDFYDEPRHHYDDMPYDSVEETDDAFYSMTDVIYSFPKLSKARHRGDILEFTIKNNNHLSVSSATFNLYVRGEDWISEHEPNVWTRSSSTSGNGNNARSSHTANMHIDDTTVLEPATASATVHRDDQHNLASLTESFHKLHGSNKNVNNNHHRISISINRFVHRHQQQQSTSDQEQSKKSAQPTQQQQQQRYTRIDSDFVGPIPKDAGEWIQFNITMMVSEWIQQHQQQQKHQSLNTQSADIVQEVVIKTLEPWMRQLLVLDTNSKNRPYIEIQTRDMRKHRTKRHVARDCRENDRQSRCCRYPLHVDFRKFGWDWIIAPDIYEAFYCAGECPIGFLPKHPHTYIYSLSSSFSTCCSPRKLSPLSLLYFDDNKNVIHSIIPNMAVEKCGCS